MKEVRTGKGEFIFCKVADSAGHFELKGNVLHYSYDKADVDIELPSASYTFIITTKGAKEEDLEKVIEKVELFYANKTKHVYVYKDYVDEENFYHSAPDSLNSLLTAHGLDPKNNYAILLINQK